MTFGRVLIGLAAASLAVVAAAETVSWEAAVLTAAGGREVVATGIKTYSPGKDVVVQEQGTQDRVSWLKSLLLNDTFALSASVYRERRLDGFGLAIYRRGDRNGFSWEWFDRGAGDVFEKRQGAGRVSVRTRKASADEELESIEFLDDIVLRYLDDMSKPPGTHTHEVTIKKGSVLRIAP